MSNPAGCSAGSGEIPFTQYLLPDGRPRSVTIWRPTLVAEQARKLIDMGYKLEAEILSTGDVSLTVEREPENNGPIHHAAIEVVTNGPEVLAAVDRLIGAAFLAVLSNDGSE